MNIKNSFQKEKTCCFTGHRTIPINEANRIKRETKVMIGNLLEKGIFNFIAGGALGYDTLCAFLILELKEQYPQINLHLALPCKNQTNNWNGIDIEKYNFILNAADSVTYVSETYHRGCMHERNRYMVDNSNYCIAYCTKQSGGSFFIIEYAKKKNATVIPIEQ